MQKDGHLAVLATASRAKPSVVHELDLSGFGSLDPSHASLVLCSPSMQHLRMLCVYSDQDFVDIHPTIQQAIVQLPHLHTLRLPASPTLGFIHPCEPDLGFLSQVPALTALHIQDTFTTEQFPSRLSQVAESCSNLTDLSVCWPSLYGPSSWKNFFAHPHTQQLRVLKLQKFYVGLILQAIGTQQ